MRYSYETKKKNATEREAAAERSVSSPSLDALRAGAAQPTQEQMGRRVDLPDAMRAKMEDAFGADLSAVKLYESQSVADAGAEAITQGANIAFAPGMLDFSSYGGQALLGHEISHVVSQARGEVTGGGFLSDRALEARADREGAMAAAGQQVAMPAAPMSGVTAAPAAGPMQASKAEKKVNQARDAQVGAVTDMLRIQKSDLGYADNPQYQALQKSLAKSKAKDAKWSKRLSPDAQLPSVGMRTLGELSMKHRLDPFSYFDDADAAMDILGEEPDEAMRERLSGETRSAIRNAQERIAMNQAAIGNVNALNNTLGGTGTTDPHKVSILMDTIGIDKLKQFGFRRFLDLGEDQ